MDLKKKWLSLFSKEKEVVDITLVVDASKRSILDVVTEHERSHIEKLSEEKLNKRLMNGILQFREETKSLDYIRDEIEQVMSKKDGEVKLMESFAHTINQQKKKNQ